MAGNISFSIPFPFLSKWQIGQTRTEVGGVDLLGEMTTYIILKSEHTDFELIILSSEHHLTPLTIVLSSRWHCHISSMSLRSVVFDVLPMLISHLCLHLANLMSAVFNVSEAAVQSTALICGSDRRNCGNGTLSLLCGVWGSNLKQPCQTSV